MQAELIESDYYIYLVKYIHPDYLMQKLLLNDLICKKDAAPTTWKRRLSSPMQG